MDRHPGDRQPSFDPFAPDVMACPYPALAELRDQHPVVWSDQAQAFVVSSYRSVMEVVRDPARFSSAFGRASRPVPPAWQSRIDAIVADGYPRVATLLTADPPAHTRCRRLVAKAFSPRAIAALEPTIRAICTRLIDDFVPGRAFDIVQAFTVPLPVEVIATALNVADGDLARFKAWSDATASAIGTSISLEQLEASERTINEFQHYFADQLERRRRHPKDDLLTHLLNARIDDEIGNDDIDIEDVGGLTDADARHPLDMAEMLRILQQLLVAGNETTTSLVTDLLRTLASEPGEWLRLRREPARIADVVEEGLRLFSPSSAIWRIAAVDTQLEGVAIPAGSRLIVTWMSANRDREVFGTDAERFDPDRGRLNEHVAFGFGIHHCLGAPLSRLEARLALETLTARIDRVELCDDNAFEYHPSFFLRSMKRLDVVIG